MDTGDSATDDGDANWDANFAADFAMTKKPGSSNAWYSGTRSHGEKYLHPTANNAWQTDDMFNWRSSKGFGYNMNSDWMAWMWKRGHGFDVVNYKGTGADTQHKHNLNRVPEMMWMKSNYNIADAWEVWHHGLNGGSSPLTYGIKLNNTGAQHADGVNRWARLPTSTHFSVKTDSGVNHSSGYFTAFLFASVDKISKVGYYEGNGSTSERTITVGFQPRFVVVRNVDDSAEWELLDTTRGWASGSNDQRLYWNGTNAQDTGLNDIGGPTSTGFTITENHSNWNANGYSYIYYAHA